MMSNASYPSSLSTFDIWRRIENSTFTSTAIQIVNKDNSTHLNIATEQSFAKIMWYRLLLLVVIFITAAGNLLVCLAIARERKLQNTTNYFLMSLAIADCLVAVLVMPIGMISEVLGYFPFSTYACSIYAAVDVLFCTSSIWHMSTMSMDRYFTIRFPFRYGRNKTRRVMFLKIVAVWAISAAISSPVLVLGIVNDKNVVSDRMCAPNNESFKLYGSIFAFYIPFIIMVTTYGLTMSSLRNVLVNKKRNDREKRRTQAFRPLAQIINQYAESAETIRYRSTLSTQKASTSVRLINNDSNTVVNTALCTVKRSAPTSDSRASTISTDKTNLSFQSDNNSTKVVNNEMNSFKDLFHHSSEHLTVSYITPSGNKNRRCQQQLLAMNIPTHPLKYNTVISTVYETTEYSKSTSSSNDVSAITSNDSTRKSIINMEQQALEIVGTGELFQMSKLLTSTAADGTQLEPQEFNAVSNEYSRIEVDAHEPIQRQSNHSLTQQHNCSDISESIFVMIPWRYCCEIIRYVLQYYMFYFHYRSYPLGVEHFSCTNVQRRATDRSTSISSTDSEPKQDHQSVSTQTISFTPTEPFSTNCHNNSDRDALCPGQRRSSFNKLMLTPASFFRRLVCYSSTKQLPSCGTTPKSSCSSIMSSSNLIRQAYSSPQVHRADTEMEPILTSGRRSCTSTSSSSLLCTTTRHGSHICINCHKLLQQQQYQYQSMCISPQSSKSGQSRHPISSGTNTNSSESSSFVLQRPSRLLSSVSRIQRIRDERIIAANERKALRVLLIIFSVFVALWTPFFICTLLSVLCGHCREFLSPDIWFSITWLGYSSSMANPFIYTIFSDAFRRAFANIILCRSNEVTVSGPYSTKLLLSKDNLHQHVNPHLSPRRSPKHDASATSTSMQFPRPM